MKTCVPQKWTWYLWMSHKQSLLYNCGKKRGRQIWSAVGIEPRVWGWHVVTLVLWKHETNRWVKLAQNKHVVCRWHLPRLQNNTLDICVMIFCWGVAIWCLLYIRKGRRLELHMKYNFWSVSHNINALTELERDWVCTDDKTHWRIGSRTWRSYRS
jgi:hypothetical protein